MSSHDMLKLWQIIVSLYHIAGKTWGASTKFCVQQHIIPVYFFHSVNAKTPLQLKRE